MLVRVTHKAQIEKANLAELDWALANMGSGRSRKASKATIEMLEASKEDVK
jgi:hypothetical protein